MVTLFRPKRLNSFCAHSRILQSLDTLLLFLKITIHRKPLHFRPQNYRNFKHKKSFLENIFRGNIKQLDGTGERSKFEVIGLNQLSNALKNIRNKPAPIQPNTEIGDSYTAGTAYLGATTLSEK